MVSTLKCGDVGSLILADIRNVVDLRLICIVGVLSQFIVKYCPPSRIFHLTTNKLEKTM
jgi:hypothetical protein